MPGPDDQESLRDLEDNVIRDVRVGWINAQNAFDRYRITGQLLENARQSYDLAQARYQQGISSIVEFNQAELRRFAQWGFELQRLDERRRRPIACAADDLLKRDYSEILLTRR